MIQSFLPLLATTQHSPQAMPYVTSPCLPRPHLNEPQSDSSLVYLNKVCGCSQGVSQGGPESNQITQTHTHTSCQHFFNETLESN